MIVSKQDLLAHRQALTRVLESVTFHKSNRLRQLLAYLCEEEFAGRATELREYEIGVHVFGRNKDFDPGEDSIVRASVRQLRAKLLEYYAGEGVEDEWRIEIPRGSYVPAFIPRSATPEAPQPAPLPLVAAPDPPDQAGSRRAGRYLWVLTVAGFIVVFLAGRWSASPAGAGRPPDQPPVVTDSLMGHFLASTEGPIRFVPSDSVVNLVRSLTGRKLTLENYASKEFFADGHPATIANPGHWNSIVSRELMNIGDASIVLRAAREHPEEVGRFSFRQARDLRMRDLKEGNFVFLGSAQANPWIRVFEDSLNFRISAEGEEAGRWPNISPLPGEQESYPMAPLRVTANSEVSYGHIALIPNQSGSGKVLMAGGNSMPDTEAAGEFVLSSGSAKTIAAFLGIESLRKTPYFEVLLETNRAGSARRVSKILAGRKLAGVPMAGDPTSKQESGN